MVQFVTDKLMIHVPLSTRQEQIPCCIYRRYCWL